MMQILSRRHFLQAAAAGLAIPALLRAQDSPPVPFGKAQHCIFLWLGGGRSHVDTFDPKRRGDKKKFPGAYYDAIDSAISGIRVTERLSAVVPESNENARYLETKREKMGHMVS